VAAPIALPNRVLRAFWFVATFGGEQWIVALLGIACLVVTPLVILRSQGDFHVVLSVLGTLAVALVTLYRLDWGLCIFFGMILLCDNYEVPGFSTWTFELGYFWPLNSLFPGLGIGIVNPMELHLLLIFSVWGLVAILQRRSFVRFRPGIPAILFFLWLLQSLWRGMSTGGDLQWGLWEVRALGYLGLTVVLVPQIIQTRAHIENLIWVCLTIIPYKAVQGLERFISSGFNFGGSRTLTNHEDPVFIVTLFILLGGLTFIGGNPRQRRTLLWLLPILIAGFYIGNRRAAYAGFAVGTIVLISLMSGERLKRLMKPLIAVALVFCIYLAAYWNTTGRIGMVAQTVRSTIFAGDRELVSSYEDFTSGLARDQENYNTAASLRQAPVMGIGFGRKFEEAIQSWGSYALKGYICHNQIFWILGKTGAVGFFFFFFFLNSVVMRGAHVFRNLQDPYLQTVCAVAIIAVVSQVVVSYADMQLTYYRNMTYLGMFIGLIPVMERISRLERRAG